MSTACWMETSQIIRIFDLVMCIRIQESVCRVGILTHLQEYIFPTVGRDLMAHFTLTGIR